MPVNKLRPSKRAAAAIAAVMAGAVSVGGIWYAKAPSGKQYPAAVVLAVEAIIKDWEGLRTAAYLDIVSVPTICYGETKGVRLGMRKTKAECEAMLYDRVYRDFYLPIVACAAPLTAAPVPVQASMVSGAYNFGVGTVDPKSGWCGSSAAAAIRARNWPSACVAQTAWNKAGGKVVKGLVDRREMGNAAYIGEGELCVTGVQ